MAFLYPEVRNFQGLYLQANSFTVPDGGLEEADNLVVAKEGIITKRRGYYTYFDPASGTLNNLFNYQEKLLAVYGNKIGYYADTGSSPNEMGTETLLSGQTVTVTDPRISRPLQSNNNLYFTTDTGVLKITAYNSAISASGAPLGLDLGLSFINGTSDSWFEGGTTVGYRVLFGYRDANSNLIIGAPSDIATINNTEVALASGGGVATVGGGGPYTVTVTSTAHGLVTGQYLVFSNATSVGPVDEPNAEGIYQITVTNANVFTYSIVANTAATPLISLTYSYSMPVRLEFTVPSDITTALTWFYQIYRSSQQTIAVGVLPDFRLIQETNLTSTEISGHVVFFTDDIPDILLGAELYTNENSREGELQANYRAPLCNDVALYKNYAIYAKCTTRHILPIALVDTSVLANNDYVEIKVDATTRRYVARTGVANQTVRGVCSSSAGLLITSAAHGLVNDDTVYISNQVGGTIAQGTYYVVSSLTNTFKVSLTSGGAAIAYASETSLDFQGVTNGTYPIFFLSTNSSAAVRLQQTASELVKAINRDQSSLIYAQYTSTPTSVPGLMRYQAKGFTGTIYMRANTTTAGTAFSPALPDSFSVGTQVASRNDDLPHVFFVAKANEPEAVPLVNFFIVGAKNKEILRVHALRDSLIVLKTDGVYRVTGDNISNFTVTLLDSTVQCVAQRSSDVLNNQVVFLSNQGVCLVTESSVQIISRKIEDVIQPILGQENLSMETSGVAYESERLYLLTTTDPNNTEATNVWAYNILTEAWTRWDTLFWQAIIGPKNVMYYVSLFNDVQKERKKQTKIDYSGQNYTAAVTNVAADFMSCDITLPSGIVPEESDMVVFENVINSIIDDPVFITGDTYTVTFRTAANLADGDSAILYSRYVANIKFVPFHAGMVGRWKHFAEMLINLRDNSTSKLLISFVGNTFGGSESVTWESDVIVSGWGQFPFGFEPWGQSNTINLTQGTQPAPIIRIYVPKFQARNTFIQAVIQHYEAGEPLNFQSLSYAVRAYGERVTR